MGKKRALLVGINYPGTTYELRGCVNDVMAMKGVLRNNYGFADITMLTDNAATTAAILKALETLVAGAAPGDVLYFHYSGHGSQFPNQPGGDNEPDGMDEIICPVDLNWRDKMIRDDDLHQIFDKVPAGVNLTVSLDCCHSGSGLDQSNQYQPLAKRIINKVLRKKKKGGRYLPPPEHVQVLTEDRALTFNKPRSVGRDLNHTGLLLSGCESDQTSADAFIGSKYMGAFTYMLVDTLKANVYNVDYKKLVEAINNKMVQYGFAQRPELNGSTALFSYRFLQPMGTAETSSDSQSEGDTSNLNVLGSAADVTSPDANATADVLGSSGTGDATTGDGGGSGGGNKLLYVAGAIILIALATFLAVH